MEKFQGGNGSAKNKKKKKKRRGPYTSESQAVLKMVRQSGNDESDNQA